MYDFEVLTTNTSIMSCVKVNDIFAEVSGKRRIFHKDFDITEIIGEKLAGIRGIKSVHYFPGCFGDVSHVLRSDFSVMRDNIRICSFDFVCENIIYLSPFLLRNISKDRSHLEYLLSICQDDENRVIFINEVLELMALDIYMDQRDREGNIMYKKENDGKLSLAPIFDYECSFYEDDDETSYYECIFGKFSCIDDYKKLMDKYPQFRNYLSSYLDVDLEKEIREMFNERNFEIRDFDIDFYKRCDERNHKRLEKILER